jgi:hypothetical protein
MASDLEQAAARDPRHSVERFVRRCHYITIPRLTSMHASSKRLKKSAAQASRKQEDNGFGSANMSIM